MLCLLAALSFLGVHIRLLIRCTCKNCFTRGQSGQSDQFSLSLK